MSQNLSNIDTVSQVEGNIVSDMDGEKVMFSMQNGKYYNLGEIGGEIWGQIKEPISINLLIAKLMDQYDVKEKECQQHVIEFLDTLLNEELIKRK